jgi:hypothetical protein
MLQVVNKIILTKKENDSSKRNATINCEESNLELGARGSTLQES